MTYTKWHRELDIFIQIKSGIVLEGNVGDVFSYPEGSAAGSFLSLTQYLYYYFKSKGYCNVVTYDRLQGFENRYSQEELSRFATLCGTSASGQRVAAPFTGSSGIAAELIRDAMSQTEQATVVILTAASRYVSAPDRLMQEEVDAFSLLQQGIASAFSARGTDGKMLRNLVVLITAKQNDLPAWFFLENPSIKTIRIEYPTAEERRQMLEGERLKAFFRRDVYEEDSKAYEQAPEDLRRLIERFIARTEGLSNTEMNNLRSLCRSTGIRIPNLCSVVDLYTYGIQDNPWESETLLQKLEHAEEIFTDRVKGQEHAIRQTMDVIKRSVMGLSGAQHHSGTKPKGILFFAGPTGTGKTETAKALAEILFGDEKACIRFDMSEYSQSHSDQRLLGAPPGYVGYEAGGQLTNAIRKNPFCILLFDEIEKAAPSIMDKFLQILEDGRMTDGQGQTVYFSECIIIFTSNLGIFVDNGSGQKVENVSFDMPGNQVETLVKKGIGDFFKLTLGRPEILNRIGENIVVFDFIRPDVAREILSSRLEKLAHSLLENKRIRLTWDAKAFDHVLGLCSENLMNGGRGIMNIVESAWINPLSRVLFDNKIRSNASVHVKNVIGSGSAVELDCEVQRE